MIKKKVVLTVLLLCFIILFVESLGFLTYFAVFKECYSKRQMKNMLKQNLKYNGIAQIVKTGTGELFSGDQVEILHPYFGYLRDPERSKGISDNGFPSYQKRQHPIKTFNQITIGVFGGSFAKETFFLGIDHLKECFSRTHKKVNIINFSIGGYKQPQQLMVLNYLLSTGAQFDIVVNIDGFNEVALPYVENLKLGVSPFYPRNWLYRTKSLSDPIVIGLIGKMHFLRDLKRSATLYFKEYKLYRSPTLALIWRLLDNAIYSKIALTQVHLQELGRKGLGFAVKGPEYCSSSKAKMFDDLADLWMRSSLSMHYLCKAYNIKYFHFLQPNQYDSGSKIISLKERTNAFDPKHPYRDGVLNGYPRLRKRGALLIQNNVNFFDLTDAFKDHSETLYKDTCCHLNERGYQLIVEKICEFIM